MRQCGSPGLAAFADRFRPVHLRPLWTRLVDAVQVEVGTHLAHLRVHQSERQTLRSCRWRPNGLCAHLQTQDGAAYSILLDRVKQNANDTKYGTVYT